MQTRTYNNAHPIVVKYKNDAGLGKISRQMRRLSTYTRVGFSARTGRPPISGPVWAMIGPNSECNYSCIMCGFHASDKPESAKEFLKKTGEAMSLGSADQLAENLARMGTLLVEIIGKGEPFLHPEWADFVDAFRRRRLEVSIYTNGSTLDQEIAKALVQMGVRALRISINAGKAETHCEITGSPEGDFNKILDGAKAVAKYRRRAGTNLPHMTYGFVLMEPNYREAKLAIRHAAEAGIDSVYFKPLLKDEVAAKHAPRDSKAVEVSLEEARAEARRRGVFTNLDLREENPLEKDFGLASRQVSGRIPCYWPWFFSLIDSDGSVYGCCQCLSALGNIQEESFFRIWWGSAYRAFRRSCRQLPELGLDSIADCECNNCLHASRNAFIHSLIHPFERKNFDSTPRSLLRPIRNIMRMLRFKPL